MPRSPAWIESMGSSRARRISTIETLSGPCMRSGTTVTSAMSYVINCPSRMAKQSGSNSPTRTPSSRSNSCARSSGLNTGKNRPSQPLRTRSPRSEECGWTEIARPAEMSNMILKSIFANTWFCLQLASALIFNEPLLAQTAEKPKRNLLFIGQAKGYQHDAISTAMATLYNLGRSSGLWNTQLRTDCTAITRKPLKWQAKNLDAYDAIVFFTDGDLDLDASQKADLLSFVRDDGKGFIGVHSAAITFTGWPEYGEMLGGYFDGHPWGVFNAPLLVEDSTFPGMNNLAASFELQDEIYQIKDFSRKNVRVLMRLDADKLELTRKGVKRTDRDFAVIWARNYGKGRVLYNGLGHVQAVWDRPEFQKMWLEMIQWSMGLVPGDATPRPKPDK